MSDTLQNQHNLEVTNKSSGVAGDALRLERSQSSLLLGDIPFLASTGDASLVFDQTHAHIPIHTTNVRLTRPTPYTTHCRLRE